MYDYWDSSLSQVVEEGIGLGEGERGDVGGVGGVGEAERSLLFAFFDSDFLG